MNYLLSITSLLFILLLSAPASGERYKTDQKAVLITGATTGIGRATAEHLAAKGYFVYAGARKDADIEALNQIENIMAVRLDVTKQDQVDEAVRLIEAQGRGLWGLVNNAGDCLLFDRADTTTAKVPSPDSDVRVVRLGKQPQHRHSTNKKG